ncbi:MAG TPA: hypothetical protein VFW13_03440 [Phenylobacterium sp.]|nr:hypothetical protein [Phenylobacterium sp.]
MYWIEHAPVWLIGVVVFAGLVVTELAGFLAGRFAAARSPRDSKSDGTGYLLSAMLGLLGLLIAFTFGAASSRFDMRRTLVRDEANAIGTTYLRIQTLDEGPRDALNRLMVEYVGVRKTSAASSEDEAKLSQADAKTNEIEQRIWDQIVPAVRAQPNSTLNAPLLETTNQMFDLANSRRLALEARVPITIVRALLIYFVAAAWILGYALAPGGRRVVASSALFLVLALAFVLILDLDRPSSGRIRVSEEPILRIAASIEASEAARHAAAPAGAK